MDRLPDSFAAPPVVASSSMRRRLGVLFLLIVLVTAGLGAGAWLQARQRFQEDTEDAYVAGHIVQVGTQIPGTVTEVLVDNTEQVEAGQPLVRLDEAEAQTAYLQARAQLALAVRQVASTQATQGMYTQAIAARQAELDLARRALQAREHASVEVVAAEEVDRAREAVAVARASLASARAQLAAGKVMAGSSTVADSPAVAQAAAQLRLAYLNYRRSAVSAPLAGTIAQRSVQLGQKVAPGMPLLSIIPLDQLWVEANFKEAQIRNLRIGQPVTLVSDVYGDEVVYHGHVRGFSAGTGSAFSMLPAQNAAGNWIKVVQRVPIVIAIDAADLKAHPLRLGFSMHAVVDTHQRDGARVGEDTPPAAHRADSHDPLFDQADVLISQLIHDNLPRAAQRVKP